MSATRQASQEPPVSATEQAPLEPPASAVSAARRGRLVLPLPPDDDEKYAYIHRNLPYLTTLLVIGAGCLIISQIRFEAHDPVPWPFILFTAIYIIYQVISLPVNFTGRGFDSTGHQARVRAWRPAESPSVDVYLPICGEPIEMLRNTWSAVSELVASYGGVAKAHVL